MCDDSCEEDTEIELYTAVRNIDTCKSSRTILHNVGCVEKNNTQNVWLEVVEFIEKKTNQISKFKSSNFWKDKINSEVILENNRYRKSCSDCRNSVDYQKNSDSESTFMKEVPEKHDLSKHVSSVSRCSASDSDSAESVLFAVGCEDDNLMTNLKHVNNSVNRKVDAESSSSDTSYCVVLDDSDSILSSSDLSNEIKSPKSSSDLSNETKSPKSSCDKACFPYIKSAWYVVEQDRGHRKRIKNQFGSFRSKNRKVNICYICKSEEHYYSSCPSRICSICFEKGHSRYNCVYKLFRLTCSICKKRGHVTKGCPAVWRKYRLCENNELSVPES